MSARRQGSEYILPGVGPCNRATMASARREPDGC